MLRNDVDHGFRTYGTRENIIRVSLAMIQWAQNMNLKYLILKSLGAKYLGMKYLNLKYLSSKQENRT